MFGVCSFATAQSAKSGSKLGKATTTAETAPSTSFTTASDEAPVVKQDKTAVPKSDQAVAAAIAPNTTAPKATVVNADGTVEEMPAAKQMEMKKAAAAKAAATKKSDN